MIETPSNLISSAPDSKPRPDVPRFELRGVSVRYGDHRALAGVDLTIPRDGITALVGPSGCGKSTLIATLNRMVDLTVGCHVEGIVRMDGADIRGAEVDVLQLRRRVGMVFQRPNPFPLSIRRNLALPLREHGTPPREIDAISRAALEDVGLWEEVKNRLDSPADALSGGQQQRLCIARALALQPEAILFDEPCSALDPIASGVVEDLISSLRGRVTVVIVTHDLAQARRIADRTAVLWMTDGAGRIVECDDTARLFDSPADPIARDYLRGARS